MRNRVKTHLIQARRHSDQGNRKQALDSIKKALVIDPGEMVITEVLISMERAENTIDQDENNNTEEIAIGGTSTERNKTADMDSKLEKIFSLSDEALASGNDSKALAYLKKAVQLFPDEHIADQKMQQLKNRIRAGNLVKIGKKKLSEGDIEKAITASRRAFDLLPAIEGLEKLLNDIEKVGTKITRKKPDPGADSTPAEESIIPQKEPETLEEEGQGGEALLWADRIRTAVKDDNFEEAGKMVAEAVRRHPDDTLLNSFYSKLKRLGFVAVI
ncbi:MAG: hypothetical protein U9P42_10945 [Candidatus Fermentibacteria bacterium]|nr:hypothetical protein [Candidatus Fermentibacteria bacterium]